LRFNDDARIVRQVGFGCHVKELAMPGIKRIIFGSAAAAALACVLATPAAAGVHGFLHPWGFGRGLVGAAVGLATLPLAIASAALSASEPEAPYQSSGYARGYGPPPAYYAAPQTYYAAPPAYYSGPQSYYAPPRPFYPRAPVYYSAPRAYFAPRAQREPRAGYYGGHASYHSGGYAYPHR
jgi:hypothetical protein